jgi:uncharacterized coiled-coil protein SlyX
MLKVNSNMDIEEILHYCVDDNVSALLYPKFKEQHNKIVDLDLLLTDIEGEHEKAIEELAAEISNHEDTIYKLEKQNDDLQYKLDEFVEQLTEVVQDSSRTNENMLEVIMNMIAVYKA